MEKPVLRRQRRTYQQTISPDKYILVHMCNNNCYCVNHLPLHNVQNLATSKKPKFKGIINFTEDSFRYRTETPKEPAIRSRKRRRLRDE